jgi:hypothetical protein
MKHTSSDHRARPRWLRITLATLCLLMLAAPSCAPGFDATSKVNTLRILAVTADKSYALPGDDITLRMTLHDGLSRVNDNVTRPLQIVWLAGCTDPESDSVFLCFPQFAELLAPLAGMDPMGPPPADLSELIKFDAIPSGSDGEPDALEFGFTLPDDIVSRRPVPQAGPHYGISFVFFAACAGQLRPASLDAIEPGEVPDFPLECQNIKGEKLGNDSFVIGYTQVYAFADGRSNANPPIEDITIDGAPISTDPAAPTLVDACPVTAGERREASCGSTSPTESCRKYALKAEVRDIAEIDPGAVDADGTALREVLWVSYFVDGGDVGPSLTLVSDAVEGYIDDHDTEWIPPDVPGVYSIWAVLRDQRGGQSVTRRYLQVQ